MSWFMQCEVGPKQRQETEPLACIPRGLNSNLLMASISMSTTWWNYCTAQYQIPKRCLRSCHLAGVSGYLTHRVLLHPTSMLTTICWQRYASDIAVQGVSVPWNMIYIAIQIMLCRGKFNTSTNPCASNYFNSALSGWLRHMLQVSRVSGILKCERWQIRSKGKKSLKMNINSSFHASSYYQLAQGCEPFDAVWEKQSALRLSGKYHTDKQGWGRSEISNDLENVLINCPGNQVNWLTD